jgi:hypothetical protein
MVYCCVASVLLSIDLSIVSIKKLVFQPCTRFRYVARKYVDDKSEKGRIFAPEVNSLIPVNADIIGATDLDWEAAGKAFGTNRFLKYLSTK